MKHKIVFVSLNYNMHVSYHHGIGILSAVAKKHGAESTVYHVHSDLGNPPDEKKCAVDISGVSPSIVCISSSSLEWGFAKLLAKEIRRGSHAIIVAGGPHTTFCGGIEDGFELFDYIVVGEGERVIESFAHGNPPAAKKVIGPMVQDLDSLPFSDRESFSMQKIIDNRHGIVDFITQRGCPYNCSYCSNHALRELYGGKYLRRRSIANVIHEIKEVVSRYRCKIVFFHDDTFTIKKDWEWVREFSPAYKKEIGIPFVVNSRVDSLPDDIIAVLAEAGCIEIKLGIESGDEKLRKEVLRRKIDNDLIKERFRAVHQSGIRTYAYMMHGVPGASDETYRKSVELIAEIMPNVVRSSVFFPLPNTALGDPYYHADGIMSASMIGDRPSSLINHNDEVLLEFYRFGWEINVMRGLKEYLQLINKYSTLKRINVEAIKKDDSELSKRMRRAGKVHYCFGSECSMIKLHDGEKSPF